jgi:hypothetical protein
LKKFGAPIGPYRGRMRLVWDRCIRTTPKTSLFCIRKSLKRLKGHYEKAWRAKNACRQWVGHPLSRPSWKILTFFFNQLQLSIKFWSFLKGYNRESPQKQMMKMRGLPPNQHWPTAGVLKLFCIANLSKYFWNLATLK